MAEKYCLEAHGAEIPCKSIRDEMFFTDSLLIVSRTKLLMIQRLTTNPFVSYMPWLGSGIYSHEICPTILPF